jgi:hypothetical protein
MGALVKIRVIRVNVDFDLIVVLQRYKRQSLIYSIE